MAKVFDLELELAGVTPRIWRRVRVPAAAALPDLHHVIQAVMGWDDRHLHVFEVAGREYSVPPDEDWEREAWDGIDEATMTLSRAIAESGGTFHYVYDFGDDWRVAVRLVDDSVVPGPPQARVLGGERAAPPENIGGPGGYQQILDAWLSGSRRDLSKEVRESLPRRFDPAFFDLSEAAERLRSAMPLDPGEEATPLFADADEQLIADLTLLTLYLGSWEESSGVSMSWKTMRFEVLDVLKREGLIDTTPARKSLIITEQGVRRATRLHRRVAGIINGE
jgi:Plasmid pRiA4b ORF-3-like protein/Domain of unknown function (DUF6429)